MVAYPWIVIYTCLRFPKLLQERLRAGVGNDAQVLNKLFLGHADSGVLDGQSFGLLVRGYVDLERAVRLGVLAVVRGGEVAELFDGVVCVGHELADEHFLLRVQGLCDDLEKHACFRLA